jgi:hypothetical protein
MERFRAHTKTGRDGTPHNRGAQAVKVLTFLSLLTEPLSELASQLGYRVESRNVPADGHGGWCDRSTSRSSSPPVPRTGRRARSCTPREAAAFALLPGIAPAQLREIRVKCNTVPLIAVGGGLTFQ